MNWRYELVFVKQLSWRLLALLFIWMLCRLSFYGFNSDAFPFNNLWDFFKLIFIGIRFDLAAIAYVNALLVLSYLLPFSFRKNPTYRNIQKWIFLIFNGIALSAEVVDMGYFQFSHRRAIGSDLNLLGETTNMFGQFVNDFWYLIFVFAMLIWLLYFVYKKTNIAYPSTLQNSKIQWIFFPLGIGLLIIGMRGGLQLRPIMSLTTAKYVDDMRLMPLQTNTTLNLLFSAQQNFLQEKKYMSEAEQLELINIYKNPQPTQPFKKENVIIIVLESFGKEHIGFFNDFKNSPTPFLDSLIGESYYFENGFASEFRSVSGITAISSSIPAMMESPLMFSPYQGNQLDGIASYLGKKGYTSGFFHGANPGSMEFEKFSKLTGYQKFYDREDYPNQDDYDGNWGIWDDPFFQFTAQKVDAFQQPFVSLLFSLTSHHPYHVPDFFEKKHPNENQVLRAIRYTDFSLKNFFETASKMDWYENTLFVITADHIGKISDEKYTTNVNKYRIPIVFFKPNSNWKNKNSKIIQQTDILPTVLDYLNYDEPYVSFGESGFDSLSNGFAYMHSAGFYQIINDSMLLSFDKKNVIGLNNYKRDPLLENDIKNTNLNIQEVLEKQLKAMIQIHHQVMVRNEMVVDN